ncbi:MAG: hypothetical protein LBW85_05420 [Deltaproteobacteria bacterium]|nr:hypothetical protein [Deltaproteobacteria bacterium]
MTEDDKQNPAADAVANEISEPNLIEPEKIRFDEGATEATAPEEELNSRYVKGETRIVTEQARYPLAGILQMLKEEIIKGNAPEGKQNPVITVDQLN